MKATPEVREKILERLSEMLSRTSKDMCKPDYTPDSYFLGFADALWIVEISPWVEVQELVFSSELAVAYLAKKRGHGLSKKTVRVILEKHLKEAEMAVPVPPYNQSH